MTVPLIGITTNRNLNDYRFPQFSINQAYTQALAQAGAAPVMIPLELHKDRLDELTGRLDGIVFSGGGDIHPHRYGNPNHPLVDSVDPDRDRVELHLAATAMRHELPFLAICRGLQLINVALGGALYEDIIDQRPGSLVHSNFPKWPRNHLAHAVEIAEGSRLKQITAAAILDVNSMHHQGIERLADHARATAWAPDGLIEAFEVQANPFGLAVQWHPEHLQEQPAMQALFEAFVSACGQG